MALVDDALTVHGMRIVEVIELTRDSSASKKEGDAETKEGAA